MRLREFTLFVNLAALCPGIGHAHVSEQGFVLLLPTDAYISAGVAVVALTVLAVLMLPGAISERAFGYQDRPVKDRARLSNFASLVSFAVMVFTLWIGFTGPRDPLSNLMPLVFWTLGWVALVSLSGIVGNVWAWMNPWQGLYHLIGPVRPVLTLPERLGVWPAVLVFFGFSAFLLADIAPDDPARLASRVVIYWGVMFAGLIVFGRGWLGQAELGHVIFRAYGDLAPFQPGGAGGPGWRLLTRQPVAGAGVFALVLLAVGSFDGLNETFWWLGLNGINPLEFPGRSAVVGSTLMGLAGACVGLISVFAVIVWAGLRLVRSDLAFAHVFGWLAVSLLPIALVYHISHYLPSFLVAIQYTVAAVSDPFATGTDWLGLQPFRVTTGFFNAIDTVRIIWITQAGLVVFGHVWSVLLSHRIALRLFVSERQARLATLPLSMFMIAYTFLGLWLLATPRGA